MVGTTMDIERFVGEVLADIAASEAKFQTFKRRSTPDLPIPFFGRIDHATVLTVGVNPSDSEFEGREWPATTDTPYLTDRLLGYFNHDVPPHPWFKTWESALRLLGVSYESGVAAHLDISPRATIPMGQITNVDLFLQMARRDVKWLFKLLNGLRQPRLVLLAGCVTKKRYINHLLKECGPTHSWRVLGEAQKTGSGRIGYHAFEAKGRLIPGFFCSISPSGNNKHLLLQRISENIDQLQPIIARAHHGWISDRNMLLTPLPSTPLATKHPAAD